MIKAHSNRLIQSFEGMKIQFFLFMVSVLTAIGYGYLDHRRLSDPIVLYMLRFFCIITDFGLFLAIAYTVQFKRATALMYLLKIIVFFSMKNSENMIIWDFLIKLVGIPFGLVVYYKITLFLLILVLSYVVELQDQEKNRSNIKGQAQQEQKKQLIEKYNVVAYSQKKQLINDDNQTNMNRTKQLNEQYKQQQSIHNRIFLSILYHKQNSFYRTAQLFYFSLYFSTIILILFPIQDYIIDYTKVLSILQQLNTTNLLFLNNLQYLDQMNNEIINYVNYHSVINIIGLWGVFLIGEVKIKNKYPELMKQYVLSIPVKIIIINAVSLIVFIIVLFTLNIQIPQTNINNTQTHTTETYTTNNNNNQLLSSLPVMLLINMQILGTAILLHSLVPIFISFIFIRLYLGKAYSLNKLVSKKYRFYQNDNQFNLDEAIYELVIQNDINKVRYTHKLILKYQQSEINKQLLQSHNTSNNLNKNNNNNNKNNNRRYNNNKSNSKQFMQQYNNYILSLHKLKRYTQQQKFSGFLTPFLNRQISHLFSDTFTLSLYNNLSRILILISFYLSLFIYILSLNINDKYIFNKDDFFPYKPVIILLVMLYFVNKYENRANLFYNKWINTINEMIKQKLIQYKSYNVIRLIHFYTIILMVYLYRVYCQIYYIILYYIQNKQQQYSQQKQIKQILYEFYTSDSFKSNQIISSLLLGYKQYFISSAQTCSYNHRYLLIQTIMLLLIIWNIVSVKYYYLYNKNIINNIINKNKKIQWTINYNQYRWNLPLIIIQILTPLYLLYVLVIDLDCIDSQKVFFTICYSFSVMFIHTNYYQIFRDTQKQKQQNY